MNDVEVHPWVVRGDLFSHLTLSGTRVPRGPTQASSLSLNIPILLYKAHLRPAMREDRVHDVEVHPGVVWVEVVRLGAPAHAFAGKVFLENKGDKTVPHYLHLVIINYITNSFWLPDTVTVAMSFCALVLKRLLLKLDQAKNL